MGTRSADLLYYVRSNDFFLSWLFWFRMMTTLMMMMAAAYNTAFSIGSGHTASDIRYDFT